MVTHSSIHTVSKEGRKEGRTCQAAQRKVKRSRSAWPSLFDYHASQQVSTLNCMLTAAGGTCSTCLLSGHGNSRWNDRCDKRWSKDRKKKALVVHENVSEEMEQRMSNSKNKQQPPHLHFLLFYSVPTPSERERERERSFFLHRHCFSLWLIKVISNHFLLKAQI